MLFVLPTFNSKDSLCWAKFVKALSISSHDWASGRKRLPFVVSKVWRVPLLRWIRGVPSFFSSNLSR